MDVKLKCFLQTEMQKRFYSIGILSWQSTTPNYFNFSKSKNPAKNIKTFCGWNNYSHYFPRISAHNNKKNLFDILYIIL